MNNDIPIDKRIKRIFYIQVFLFIGSISIITITSTLFLSYKQIRKQIISDFNHDLEATTIQLNYKFKISMENIKAISSRTMIRKELYKWHKGEISIDQIKSYTQSKYEDGASVYEELLYAERTDIHGNLIAIYEPNPLTEYLLDDKAFFKDQNGYNLILQNEIVYNKEIIGYDKAVFKLGSFTKGKSGLLQDISILNVPKENNFINNYAASIQIGQTDYYLYSELNQQVLKTELSNRILSILIQSILIIVCVIVVSYFTILKLALKLVNKLNESARIDPLTNLLNRKALQEKVEETIQLSVRYNFSFAILYIDIDGFKPVNDSYGHSTGDKLLRMIGTRLLKTVRSSDTVFRIGGDEFVILISQIDKRSDANLISEKILESLSDLFEIGSEKINIGASIGISISTPNNNENVDELLSKADFAMYEVKKTGKNNYKISRK